MNLDDIYDVLASSGYEFDGSWTVDQLTDLLVESGLDIAAFSEAEIEQLLSMCTEIPPAPTEPDPEPSAAIDARAAPVSFTGAERCYWCSGSGVVWTGSENEPCTHCGGSGVGPE